MLYCEKCRGVCPDSTEKCPNCKNRSLREAAGDDMVRLHRADEYTAGRLGEMFDAAGIVYETEPFNTGHVSYLYDSEVMPTDRNVFVRYSDLEAAKQISAGLRDVIERERAGEAEEPDDTPMGKRIAVRMIAVIIFLIVVIGVVLAADAAAGWLKSLFNI